MDAQTIKDVDETVLNLFGTMFFVALIPEDEIPAKEEWNHETVFIEGAIDIASNSEVLPIRLYFPPKLAKEITINFLGIEDDEFDDEKMLDSIKEATNMTVGGLLGRIDPKARCSIGIPEARKIENFSPDRLSSNGLRIYRADSDFLWLTGTNFKVCDSR